jgi:hypothetical protein
VTLSLLLNLSPIEFDDVEIDAGVFSYGPEGNEVLKKLRQKHCSTHVFRREGPDQIVAVPVVAGASPELAPPTKAFRGDAPKRMFFKDPILRCLQRVLFRTLGKISRTR